MRYSASIICMDPLDIEADVELLYDLGIDSYHADVMDRSFVPRMGLYPELVREISSACNIPIDVHLMVDEPARHLPDWCQISNVRNVFVHAGPNTHDLFYIADQIRSFDKEPGLVLNLSEGADVLLEASSVFRTVMLMGISPGVLGGRTFPEVVSGKVIDISSKYSFCKIHIDGAVSFETIPRYSSLRAPQLFDFRLIDTCVVGSSTLFRGAARGGQRKNMIRVNYKRLRELA